MYYDIFGKVFVHNVEIPSYNAEDGFAQKRKNIEDGLLNREIIGG